MSLDDLLLVPAPKSALSSSATFSPRSAASRAIPAPVIPPPITKRSNCSRSRVSQVCRRVAEVIPSAPSLNSTRRELFGEVAWRDERRGRARSQEPELVGAAGDRDVQQVARL